MLLTWLFFIFIAIGAKAVLAVATIYLLFPTDRQCSNCDGEMLLLQLGRGGRIASRLLRGRLQRRWCPRCGAEGWARTAPSDPRLPPAVAAASAVRSRR